MDCKIWVKKRESFGKAANCKEEVKGEKKMVKGISVKLR